MSAPLLVIFVDAYPFADSAPLVKRLGASTYKKVTPGVGYSINVKSEIFAQMKPDDVGYFCEWVYKRDKVHTWMTPPVVSVLSALGSISTLANRIVHKLVRMVLKEPIYAIPFDVLPFFKNAGATAYDPGFDHPTFLSKLDFDRVLYSEIGVNDRKVFTKAMETLRETKPKRLFVSTAELDGVMHHHGKDCERYDQQVALIDDHVVDLVTEFKNVHGPEARYFIFSDHGMCPVTEAVEFDIRGVLGKPGQDSYAYFIDATFFRVWLNDKALEPTLLAAFEKLGHGHVLTQSERAEYGLTNASHGDVIFLLDELKMFAPSFFGNEICKAMHGYDPALESQQGTLISNFDAGDHTHVHAQGIYDLVMQAGQPAAG
ncbi:MAG: alkaline phosphatase family protein [Gammaproteobacteria bacterium]